MKVTLRHLSGVVALMFLSLMISSTYIQVFNAPTLNANGHNYRTLVRNNIANRGPIMIGKEAIATSKPVDDKYHYLRTYTDGKIYAPVIGYYAPTLNASTGLEKVEANILTGSDDSFVLQRLRTLLSGEKSQGGSISLTINPEMQKAAYNALGNQKGAVVALDPHSGAVLTLVSTPSYDPNILASHDADVAYKEAEKIRKDPDQPLLNRAIDNTYAPGSIFKIITSTPLLESGLTPNSLVDAPTKVRLPGTNTDVYNFAGHKCGDGSGKTKLVTAIKESCNTVFALAAQKMGFNKLNEAASRYGFYQDIEIPLYVTPSSITKSPNKMDDASLMLSGFGQKDNQVTPLQAAMIASTVANKGSLMKPYLVNKAISSDLSVISETKPQQIRQVTSAQVANDLKYMMEETYQFFIDDYLKIPNVKVGIKTGTAETAPNLPKHSWVIGFAPAENPRIAFAAFVEYSGNDGFHGTGGTTAFKVAREILMAGLKQ